MTEVQGIPSTIAAWRLTATRTLADRYPDLKLGLRAMPSRPWRSASKMGLDHFLLLRAYWTHRTADQFDLSKVVGSEAAGRAIETMRQQRHFNVYLDSLSSRTMKPTYPPLASGPFALVLYQQDQVSRLSCSTIESNPKLNVTPRYFTRARAVLKADQASPTPYAPILHAEHNPSYVKHRSDKVEAILNTPMAKISLRDDPSRPIFETPTNPEFDHDIFSQFSESVHTDLSHLSPLSPTNVKTASDEQVVNTALVSFLQAATMYVTSDAAWALDRNVFRMRKLYEARTDGCLLSHGKTAPLAILETKAHVRKKDQSQIMIQETAQMAAWIQEYDSGEFVEQKQPTARCRLLISQDNCEIYVTIASYDPSYKDYLRRTSEETGVTTNQEDIREAKSKPRANREGSKERTATQVDPDDPFTATRESVYEFDHNTGPFLKMSCYGPFDTGSRSHMKSFAIAVVAFTLILEDTQS